MPSQSTDTRGDWLFRKMAAIYGSTFLDKWRDVDMVEMKAEWTAAMRGMHGDALRRGIAALYHVKNPPNLPEFLDLCKPPASIPAMHRQNALALTNEADRTPPEQAREQLGRIRDLAQGVMREAHATGSGIEWAHRIIRRAAGGEHITSQQMTVAQEAIAAWDLTNPRYRAKEPEIDMPTRVPSPHIYDPDREPGWDDE